MKITLRFRNGNEATVEDKNGKVAFNLLGGIVGVGGTLTTDEADALADALHNQAAHVRTTQEA